MAKILVGDIIPLDFSEVGNGFYLHFNKDMLEFFDLLNENGEVPDHISKRLILKAEHSNKYGNYFGIGIEKRKDVVVEEVNNATRS